MNTALAQIFQGIEYEIRGRLGNHGVFMFHVGVVLLGVSILVIIGLLIFTLFKYFKLRMKYKGVIDIDSEISGKNKALDSIVQNISSMNTEYIKAKEIFDRLKRELDLVEENAEYVSFGVYKPHYDFKMSIEYKRELERVYEQLKEMIRNKQATISKYKIQWNGSVTKGQSMVRQYTKLMLRAFNGEADSAILKVRWNNAIIMHERIEKAFEAVNKLGEMAYLSISDTYKELKIKELELTHEYEEKLNQEKEEQRKIREQMREEEKVRREIEEAKRDAEDEEARYQKALEKAKKDVEKAKGEELDELNRKIVELTEKLNEATALKERAISRAQMTKSGHVYVISNIGSFGENVFKIGMTRRLEPLDRVDELGDASVPFDFDVHAMIYSENAPALENELQAKFEDRRVNLVNPRREFFATAIDEIEKTVKDKGLNVQFSKLAEARQYRETLKIRQTLIAAPVDSKPTVKEFPESLSLEQNKES